MDLGVLKCKYRKDDKEEYKIHRVHVVESGVVINTIPVTETEKQPSEDLEVCGVCGNPDVVNEDDDYIDDDSWTLNWVKCGVCHQWFHEICLGLNIDTNDFLCSEKCVKIDNSTKTGKKNGNRKNMKK
jgi:hypothetical protein